MRFLFGHPVNLDAMDAWSNPVVPSLPGLGEQLRLFDTSSSRLVAVGPTAASGQPARMYVCGITPYDATHLGHGATYIAFDLVNRVWRDAGKSVHYVQNVTDIDDPLLDRAQRDAIPWHELAQRETRRFADDMAALGVLAPTDYVGVVEQVSAIIETIDKLRVTGAAYTLNDGTGDVYFDLSTAPEFGYESGYDNATMMQLFAERGGDPQRSGKRNPLDPLLWRSRRDGEPFWEAPFGAGRPGWHIECSVIAVNYLGMQIDIQGGGEDLIFPHHEMSAAHAEVATEDHPFARAYVHTGAIGFDGEKMSKSKGNLVFSSQLRAEGMAPNVIRLALISGHYRTYREWDSTQLTIATQRLAHWREAIQRGAILDARPLLASLRQHLANDLDTPAAITAVDEWAKAVLSRSAHSSAVNDSTGADLAHDAIDALLGIKIDSR